MTHDEHQDFIFLLPRASDEGTSATDSYVIELTSVNRFCHVLQGNEIIGLPCSLNRSYANNGSWCDASYSFGKEMKAFGLPAGTLKVQEKDGSPVSAKWSPYFLSKGEFINYIPLLMAIRN